MYDILIKNANIYNGTGDEAFFSNIMIKDGIIAKIGDAESAFYEIDADGLVVSPGFIDPHTHYDNTVLYDKQIINCISQGVTTIITGLCGLGLVPSRKEDISKLNRLNSGMVDYRENFEYHVANMKEYLHYADGAAVNVSGAVAHIPLRVYATGGFHNVAYEQIAEKMKAVLRENIDMGAIGLSIGLDYFPTHSSLIANRELIDLCRVLKEKNAVLLAHVRPSENGLDGEKEVCEVAKQTGVRAHILHTRTTYPGTCGRPNLFTDIFENAICAGADISVETYPYYGGQTYGIYYLPLWAQVGEPEEILERINIPQNKKIIAEILTDNYEKLVYYKPGRFAYVKNHPEYEGRSFECIAENRGQTIGEMMIDVLIESELEVSITSADGMQDPTINKQLLDDLMYLLQKDYYTIGSDSMNCGSMTHPRAFGSFAKVLRLTREYDLSLEKTIYKITKFNADRFGFEGRGHIQVGKAADIAIFDYANVCDKASYEMARACADGIKWVIVNGQIALANGKATGIFAGRSLKRSS